jgi:hypothetical protein
VQLLVEVVWLVERVVLHLLLVLWFFEERTEIALSRVYFFKRLLVEPFYSFTFFPETVFYGHSWRGVILIDGLVDTEAVLFTAHPLSHVYATVSPFVNTIAMFFIVLVLAHVTAAIGPGVDTHAMHIIVEPFTLELPSVEPTVGTMAFDFIFIPFALIF